MSKLKTSLVGILNITPDSFSDGGIFNNAEAALEKAKEMVKNGASIIDIGAESTRPGATLLSSEEEWKRLAPVLEILRENDINAWLSIDTRHHDNAIKAIHTGIDWINDVSGFSSHKMVEAVADNAVNIVLMHNMGIPADPQKVISENDDPVKVIIDWGLERIDNLIKYGINKNRIIFDPGIGFGKTPQQSYEIIKRIEEFNKLKIRILVGHSRKSFLNLFTNKKPQYRDDITAIFSAYLADKKVDYLRIHNVKVNKQAINNCKKYGLPILKDI
jgi:dihydropteroate synthase